MRKRALCLPLLIAWLAASAQTIVYHHLKDMVEQRGDTLLAPREIFVEKRSKSQFLLTGGADYKLTSNRKLINKNIKSRYYAVGKDTCLYVNCKRLKVNKFRFGKFYAPALWVNGRLFFCALPIGPAAVSIAEGHEMEMGVLGDAIANSTIISERVIYEIDLQTGEVEFVGKDKMLALLEGYPELKEEYIRANSEEATVTKQYLMALKKRTK